MPFLLRTVRLNRWLKAPAAPFLAAGDVPAEPLIDLNAGGNLLSVWEVADDRSNVERMVRAVATMRDHIDSMGWVVFDAAQLPAIGVEIQNNLGKSKDEGANPFHRDLVVSGNKLVALTRIILQMENTPENSGTVIKGRLKQLFAEGIEKKELPEQLKALIADKPKDPGQQPAAG
jgi:hypothetical protein